MSEAVYRSPGRLALAEIRQKGSRFLARLEAVDDRQAATGRIRQLQREYRDATHLCWAWRLGHPAQERSSDAGEPAGTAGKPILRALRVAGVSDGLGVVVRWFGGTKLGKGGLARAYAAAMRAVVEEATWCERVPSERLVVETRYAGAGAVQRLVHPPEVSLIGQSFEQGARFELTVYRSSLPDLLARLAEQGAVVHRPGEREGS